MATGVLLINFGEPDEPTLEKVAAYLQRIFLQNASLEGHVSDAALERTRQLAQRRAPGLLEEYREIGGSPLNAQADAQATALREELARRGNDAKVYSAFQFTEPSIASAVGLAKSDGIDTLVAMPGYPLCGQSTTVAALEDVRTAIRALDWHPHFAGLAGWHSHPEYLRLRSEHIATFAATNGLDLNDLDTILYFSAHGTPLKYLYEGNRYDRYVFEHCNAVAHALGTLRFAVGFQNHSNRGIPWTQPDNEVRMREVTERRLVVVPISFLKEQSETLAELDHELREFAEGLGKEFHRVPVPWNDAGVTSLLADLFEALVSGDTAAGGILGPCRCHASETTFCTNGLRDLPPSPYVPAA
jgi:ferrochelatase